MPDVDPTIPRLRAFTTRTLRNPLRAGYILFVIISSAVTSPAVLLGIGLDRVSAVRS